MEPKVQEFLRQIDLYIEESKDENFDRYLAQMKQILQQEPQRLEEIQKAVAYNMERYRRNIAKREKMSVEFKVGAGVLSGIGILFVILALGIIIRNFVPRPVQGMLLIAFFAVLWIAAQLGIAKLFPKVALGISSASIIGLSLAVVLNYREYETMPMYLAYGLLVLIAIVSWMVGRITKSTILQCMSLGGFFLFSNYVMIGENLVEAIVVWVVLAALNMLWHFGAAGEKKKWIHLTQNICFAVYSLVYIIIYWDANIGSDTILISVCGVVFLSILNMICMGSEGTGSLCTWFCGSAIQMIFIAGYGFALWFDNDTIPVVILFAIPIINLILLFVKRFEGRSQWLYYQGIILLFFLMLGQLRWISLAVGLIVFVAGLFMIKERKLLNEIVMSVYFWIFCAVFIEFPWCNLVTMAVLLGITVLCVCVPRFCPRNPRGLIYTNISLIGLVVLERLTDALEGPQKYIADSIMLVLVVATVLILWRKRFYLPQKIQGLVLALALTYMVFVHRIEIPVVASVLLMLIAVVAIVVGFITDKMPSRIYGLILALFVCVKVVVHDYWDLDLLPKSILLLCVGLLAIAIALIYAVLEHRQKRRKAE